MEIANHQFGDTKYLVAAIVALIAAFTIAYVYLRSVGIIGGPRQKFDEYEDDNTQQGNPQAEGNVKTRTFDPDNPDTWEKK